MSAYSAREARANLCRLIDETAQNHKPVLITGKRNNAVLISEDDWSAIQETLHLLNIPGMRESICGGLASDILDCSEEPGWRVGNWYTHPAGPKDKKKIRLTERGKPGSLLASWIIQRSVGCVRNI
ncbi:type II toxin-antitoxin system Phd/YefM family antitoxin [Endozoicomonas sp. 8E]|nr:type II toxin-antitoxin system Phd/YefM family antitoxin [Endozoicomonas sp. 8E]